jgi:hypothetical protein
MVFETANYAGLIDGFYERMMGNRDIAEISLGGDKWSLKEMVGHLVDSASNNHQRFIRLQLESELSFPGYDAEEWRNASRLGTCDYAFLVDFWKRYNLFLLFIIEHVDENCLTHCWRIGEEKKTLRFLVEDYFEHLKLHRALFDERIGEIRKSGW